jgi:hypothetical protein
MRSEVPCGMYTVPGDEGLQLVLAAGDEGGTGAGEAPNRYSSRKAWRRKLRIRPKYSASLTPGSDQL